MLRIDFGQSFLDHRSILVLVKKLGSIKEDEFSQLFDDISQLRTVDLSNSRTVHLRYTRHISHQFVDWGTFHTHKKLLGILTIARYSPDKDLSSIKAAHESLKTWYSNTSLDSRCFLLGFEKPLNEEKKKHSEFVFLNQENLMEEIERQVADYAMSLFLVLESKRMDKSLEKPEKVSLLRSPLDGEMPVDVENRNRKQCIGRMKKYMADLCLVAGLPQEAVFHYSVAIDLLRAVGDSLWLYGSMEGLCAASLLCRAENKSSSFERPSLQLNVDQLSTAGPASGVGGEAEEMRLGTAIPLTDDQIIEKSEDIFQVYERHKDSKVLGVEARFKYARFFISKKMYREASAALQDVLSTEFALSDAEKIQQYSAMSIMYEDIGFQRKAAFFTRMAALNCTSQHLPLQGWTASYNLLRNALEGYRINFDKKVKEGIDDGWPELQIQLMRELIKMSEELQTPDIPIRHISYLVHVMYEHMKENDILELITLLENITNSQKHCSLVDDLVLSNGDKLPPVSLTALPVVRGLKVNVLASHLRPFVSPASPVKTPFIFSTLNKKPGKHKKGNPVVKWVEGDVGEVAMQVFNPMPFDMKVSKMTLLTEGVPFQAFPSCLALSSDGMSHPFMLLGIPEGPGQLRITGYSVEVFGIQSNCAITEAILENPLDLPLIVNVTPRLPLIQFHSSIPEVKSSVNSSHRGSSLFLDVTLYNGQSISGPIVVENIGKISVENLSMTVFGSHKSGNHKLIVLSQDHIMECLPLRAETNTHVDLAFHGQLDPSYSESSLKWTGKIKVSYSGGEAWQLGMSRQAAIDVKIEVLRSLLCSEFSVTSVEDGDGDCFELSMDVRNQTNHDIEWNYSVSQELMFTDKVNLLSAGATTRAILRLEKFDLSETENQGSVCERCTEKLLEVVKLHWRIPDLNVSGVLNLDGLQLTEEMVYVLRKYRLTFEMAVNGVKITREDHVKATSSSPALITVKISNSSDMEVMPSILNIEPFQVDDSGTRIFQIKAKVCWIGSTSTVLPKIEVGGTIEHTCGFIFLSPGQYFINVRCFEKANVDLEQSFRGRARVIKGESPSSRRSRSSRTESFTDSLLLRQRLYSAPLAQVTYGTVINVLEDSNIENTPLVTCDAENSELNNEESKEHVRGTSDADVEESPGDVLSAGNFGVENTAKWNQLNSSTDRESGVYCGDESGFSQNTITAESIVTDASESSGGTTCITTTEHSITAGDKTSTTVEDTESIDTFVRAGTGTGDTTTKDIESVANTATGGTPTQGTIDGSTGGGTHTTNNTNPKGTTAPGSESTNCTTSGSAEDLSSGRTTRVDTDEGDFTSKRDPDTKSKVTENEQSNDWLDGETKEINPRKESNEETSEQTNSEYQTAMTNRVSSETNKLENIAINEECKRQVKERKTREVVIAEANSLEELGTNTTSRNFKQNNSNEDVVKSPSVQERIMFFNSN